MIEESTIVIPKKAVTLGFEFTILIGGISFATTGPSYMIKFSRLEPLLYHTSRTEYKNEEKESRKPHDRQGYAYTGYWFIIVFSELKFSQSPTQIN